MAECIWLTRLSESRVSQMHSAIVERLQNQLERRRPEFAM